mgnify:CR=1 FL=1
MLPGRHLTVRAVITGMLIGGVMSIINLYVSLKTSWGVATTIMSRRWSGRAWKCWPCDCYLRRMLVIGWRGDCGCHCSFPCWKTAL